MLRFIGKRLVYAIITLFLIATATFFLVAGAPGDPIAAKVGCSTMRSSFALRRRKSSEISSASAA